MSTTVRFDVAISPNDRDDWGLAGWLELPLGGHVSDVGDLISRILSLDLSNVRVELG